MGGLPTILFGPPDVNAQLENPLTLQAACSVPLEKDSHFFFLLRVNAKLPECSISQSWGGNGVLSSEVLYIDF